MRNWISLYYFIISFLVAADINSCIKQIKVNITVCILTANSKVCSISKDLSCKSHPLFGYHSNFTPSIQRVDLLTKQESINSTDAKKEIKHFPCLACIYMQQAASIWIIIRLALRAETNRILQCNWLPEQVRWRYLAARTGLPTVSHQKIKCSLFHIMFQ